MSTYSGSRWGFSLFNHALGKNIFFLIHGDHTRATSKRPVPKLTPVFWALTQRDGMEMFIHSRHRDGIKKLGLAATEKVEHDI